MSAVQLAFFPFRKPLLDLFGGDFFKSIPRSPGVYLFRSEQGRVLYVGQSRDLKTRLSYYKNAKPDREPRRILRMICRARAVEFELCGCPEEAQALELELIQKYRPTYNRAMNGNPLHPYILLECAEGRTALQLVEELGPGEGQCFGAFRSVGRCRAVLHALGRLFWGMAHPGAGVWDLPLRFGPGSRVSEVGISAPDEAAALLLDYFSGTGNGLAEWLATALEVRDTHLRMLLENDLILLTEWFGTGPEMNRRISLHHQIPPLIPREQLDSLRLRTRRISKLAPSPAPAQIGGLQ